MNQAHRFQSSNLKLMNMSYLCLLRFVKSINFYKKTSNTRLLGLSGKLSDWNFARISVRKSHGQVNDLSIADVQALKEIIHAEINKSAIKCPEVIADQMLFLVIGAIQVQSQTGADDAWKLVNQSIQDFLKAQKDKRRLLVGLVATTLILILSATAALNTKKNLTNTLPDSPIATLAGKADPVTMSTLLLAYNKMKSGTCQLPQAAMLPPEQRQAFLRFVNNGVVEVQHVENLRLALGYVNCLYPQELMHSAASGGNRL